MPVVDVSICFGTTCRPYSYTLQAVYTHMFVDDDDDDDDDDGDDDDDDDDDDDVKSCQTQPNMQ